MLSVCNQANLNNFLLTYLLTLLPPNDFTLSQSCRLIMLVFCLAFIACALLSVSVHGTEIQVENDTQK